MRGYFEHLRLERADVVCVSFGKSGRTWLRVMISRVYQRKYRLAEGSLLEFDNFHRSRSGIPSVLFTHDNYLRDYTRDGGGKAAFRNKRVMLLVRHPADVAVSVFNHWKHRMRPHKALLNGYPATDDDVSPYEFLMRPCGLDKVIAFMNEWGAAIDELDQAARGKVHRLGGWRDMDIGDPYRQPREAFEEALQGIEDGVADWVKRLTA